MRGIISYLDEISQVSPVCLVQSRALIAIGIHLILGAVQPHWLVVARLDSRRVFRYKCNLCGGTAHVEGSSCRGWLGRQPCHWLINLRQRTKLLKSKQKTVSLLGIHCLSLWVCWCERMADGWGTTATTRVPGLQIGERPWQWTRG